MTENLLQHKLKQSAPSIQTLTVFPRLAVTWRAKHANNSLLGMFGPSQASISVNTFLQTVRCFSLSRWQGAKRRVIMCCEVARAVSSHDALRTSSSNFTFPWQSQSTTANCSWLHPYLHSPPFLVGHYPRTRLSHSWKPCIFSKSVQSRDQTSFCRCIFLCIVN